MTGPIPAIFDSKNIRVSLDRQIAAGGEGAIFSIANDPHRVAKIYHPERKPSAIHCNKLRLMIALGQQRPDLPKITAWPLETVHNSSNREITGFLMPRLVNFQLVQNLYNPVQRAKTFPKAGWAFQVRAAKNIAAAFEQIHNAGCLMGDVNESNIMIAEKDATARLIDCDSFQIVVGGNRHLCEVGKPDFTPPELQGKSLRGIVRTANHDRFGLAIIIYRLLFVGRHPYAGIYLGKDEPTFEEHIAKFRFAQGPAARSVLMEPPPFTPVLGDIPPKLGALFRQAFERGSEAGTRPSATDWISAINDLEQNFVTCTIDDGHNYWKGTTSCVWCRLASNGGPEYYYGVSADAGTFEVDDRRLQEIVRRLQQVERADFEYDRRKFAPNVAIVPRAMSPLTEVDTREHSIFSILLIVVATICAAFSLLIFLIPLLGVLGLIGAAASATAFFFHYRNSPKYREYLERKSLFQKASRLVQQVESEVESAILNYRQIKSSHVRAAYDSIRSCESLPSTFQQEIQALSANAELVARQRHLRLHSISDASISNIGYGRKQVLAAHQIYTAAEIDEVRIRSISGFGETLTANLVAWKNEVLRSFRFDPIAAVSPAARRVVIGKYRNQQNQLLVTAAQRVQQIEVVYNQVRQHLEKEAPRLRQVIENCERAKADLAIVK